MFALAQTLQGRKKGREKTEQRKTIFLNAEQNWHKPQKPLRAPKRQNSTTRPPWHSQLVVPSWQKFLLRFQFLKKNDQSKFARRKIDQSEIPGNSRDSYVRSAAKPP